MGDLLISTNIQNNIQLLAYKDTDVSHLTQKDYESCIKKVNYCVMRLIEKIHLFIDDDVALEYIKQLNTSKIVVIAVGKQPMYSDLFTYATQNLVGKICMVTNSDIYLYKFRSNLYKHLEDQNTVYTLTRYEHDMSCPFIKKYIGCYSHDSFIFKSPLKNTEFIDKIVHPQNVWGSENVLMYELNKCGIRMFNPCYQAIIVHLHKTELREPDRIRINGSMIHKAIPCKMK
jgi:hypothetical protein